MRVWPALLLILFFGNAAAGQAAPELIVAVAANLQYPFAEIQAAFEKETGTVIKPVFGSSGKFVAQIENGAPFDAFLSADTQYPEALAQKGLTLGEPEVYAHGTLILWTQNGIDLSRGLADLAAQDVRKIAVASPETAPYGRQAINALKKTGIYEQVKDKLVYGESIAQVNQFISSKAADVGLTSKSVVFAPNLKQKGTWIDVDKASYEPIAQAAVILKHAETHAPEAAQKFFDFLFSETAQEIFKKYGYEGSRFFALRVSE